MDFQLPDSLTEPPTQDQSKGDSRFESHLGLPVGLLLCLAATSNLSLEMVDLESSVVQYRRERIETAIRRWRPQRIPGGDHSDSVSHLEEVRIHEIWRQVSIFFRSCGPSNLTFAVGGTHPPFPSRPSPRPAFYPPSTLALPNSESCPKKEPIPLGARPSPIHREPARSSTRFRCDDSDISRRSRAVPTSTRVLWTTKGIPRQPASHRARLGRNRRARLDGRLARRACQGGSHGCVFVTIFDSQYLILRLLSGPAYASQHSTDAASLDRLKACDDAGTSMDGDVVKKSTGLRVILCTSQGICQGRGVQLISRSQRRGAHHREVLDSRVVCDAE